MDTKEKDNLFSDKMFKRLWFPSMAMAFGLALGDMADAIVVGQKMGATGLAAVSLALPVYMVINVFVHGFGIGGSVKFSMLLGQGKKEEAVRSFNQILGLLMLLGIGFGILGNAAIVPFLHLLGANAGDGMVYTACMEYVRVLLCGLPVLFLSYLMNYYLRNDDHQTLAAVGFTVGNLSDLLMNIIFVMVLDMGVFGAALSTILGQVVSIVIFLPGFFGEKGNARFCPSQMVPRDLGESFRCFRVGFSSSIEYLWQFVFLLLLNRSLMRYAGEEGVAIFDMVQNMSYLITRIYEYTAKAMQPLVSTYSGEYNRKGVKNVLHKGLRYGSAVGIALSVILFVFPELTCRIFGLDGAGLGSAGTIAIRIYCLGGFVGGINTILENYYQAREDEKPAYVLSTLRSAAVLLPVSALLIPFGTPILWFFYPLNEYLSFGIFKLLEKKLKKAELPEERIYSCVIENKISDFTELLSGVQAFCEKWEADQMQQYFVNMTVEEVCQMIMRHAFKEEDGSYIEITLIAHENQEIELHLRDNAEAFDPLSDDDDPERMMDMMGIQVVKEKAKEFFYRRYQGFNTTILRI